MRLGRRHASLKLLAVAALGCGSSPAPYTGYPLHSHKEEVAAAVAGVAAVIYVAGGGCKISDCPSDMVCNPATERCERLECDGPPRIDTCPAGSQCSPSTQTCVPF